MGNLQTLPDSQWRAVAGAGVTKHITRAIMAAPRKGVEEGGRRSPDADVRAAAREPVCLVRPWRRRPAARRRSQRSGLRGQCEHQARALAWRAWLGVLASLQGFHRLLHLRLHLPRVDDGGAAGDGG